MNNMGIEKPPFPLILACEAAVPTNEDHQLNKTGAEEILSVRSSASGSWAANHLSLVIGIVLASLAAAVLAGLGVCCCVRCRRRAHAGRPGYRLPDCLAPTPSPQRRPGSPVGLRKQYQFGVSYRLAPEECTTPAYASKKNLCTLLVPKQRPLVLFPQGGF